MTRWYRRYCNATVGIVILGLSTALMAQQNSQPPAAGRGGQTAGPRESTVAKYVTAWAKTTEPEILDALKDCWTPDSTYTDPGTDPARGPAALARVILGFHKSLPGATLTQTSRLDVHHNVGRFSWHLSSPAPNAQESDGFDFVEFNADGTRITRIVGFFGPFPRLP